MSVEWKKQDHIISNNVSLFIKQNLSLPLCETEKEKCNKIKVL